MEAMDDDGSTMEAWCKGWKRWRCKGWKYIVVVTEASRKHGGNDGQAIEIVTEAPRKHAGNNGNAMWN